jgi:hypothetical protein
MTFGAAAIELYTSSDNAHNVTHFPQLIHVKSDIRSHKNKIP